MPSLTKRRLRNEIVPFTDEFILLGGLRLAENPDPILRTLVMKDESFYRTMERSEAAISAAKNHRVSALLAAGSEVVEGPSGSRKAMMLKDWTIQFLKGIYKFGTVQEKCLDAIYWGWRPLEVFWDFSMKFRGKTYWGVRYIRDKMPEEFMFTMDRKLVWVGPDYSNVTPIVFDRPEDEFHWLVCSSGSTDNPYGDALYKDIWLPWYTKSRFVQIWAQGLERSMGVLKAKEQFSFNAPDRAKSVAELAAELRTVVDKLSQHNILIERAGWTLDLLTDVKFSEAWQHPLAYLDEQITLRITGQTMTMRIGNSGSRSAAQVHRQSLMDFAKRDAKQLESWINDQLLASAFTLNFGELKEEDIPKWRSNISHPVDMDNAERLYEMGAPIDGRRLAHATGVPIVTDPTPDDLVLLKPAPQPMGEGLQGDQETDPEKEDSQREDVEGEIDERPDRTLN